MGYLAVIILVACVVVAMVTTNIGGYVTASAENAVCRVTLDSCKPASREPTASGRRDPGGVKQNSSKSAIPGEAGGEVLIPRAEPYRSVIQKWMRQKGIGVQYRRGGGNFNDKTNKTLYLDTTTTRDAQTRAYQETILYAANPAPASETIDIYTTPRDQFVQAKVTELVDRYASAASFAREVQAGGDHGFPDSPHQQTYDSGYAKAVEREEAAAAEKGRMLTDAEKQEIGKRGGRQAIYAEEAPYLTGQIEFMWDQVHPKPKRSWQCLKLWHCG